MRQGYRGYWEAKTEYEKKFPPKKVYNSNRQLVSNRLGEGRHYGCKVSIKEIGKKGKILVGFESCAGKFTEQMSSKDADIFSPGQIWTLDLIQIGDSCINKVGNEWKVFRSGEDIYTGSSYNLCLEFIRINNLEYKVIVIDNAEREN